MKKRALAAVLLIACILILIKVMVFKDVPVIRIGMVRLKFGGTQEGPANWIPFRTILPYLLGKNGLVIGGINLLGNIVLLVPIGFLVPFVFQPMSWRRTLVLAVAAGSAIEGMQVLLHIGIFDIDDVILNGFGVMIGYWLFTVFSGTMLSMRVKKYMVAAMLVLTAATAIWVLSLYQDDGLPDRFGPGAAMGMPSQRIDNGNATSPNDDPCGGTGGTGQIVARGAHTFTIKRKDGVSQIIGITEQTMMRSSAGPVAEAELKIGDRVTIVTESTRNGIMLATAVLVCNVSAQPVAK